MPVSRRAEQLRPRKQPLQARSQRTVDVVLKAAAQVFARRGYAGATTNHIAERAGVSIGSLYEYFPSKDALLVALLEDHIHQGEAVLEAAAADIVRHPRRLADAIRFIVRAMVDMHARDRDLHRVLFEEAPLSRQLRQTLAEMEARVIERVELLLRNDPEVSVPNVPLAAAIVSKAVEALTHKLVVHGGRDLDLDAYVEEIVRLVVSYLTVGEEGARGSRGARDPRARQE
jgi:AcrR family transcriptional regulator